MPRLTCAAVVLCAPAAFASWVAAPSASLRPVSARTPTPAAVAMKELPNKSRSAEVLETAKDEEEQAWAAATAEAALFARSEQGLAAQRSVADASIAALASRTDVAAALEKAKASPATPSGKVAKALKKMSGSLALVGEGVRMDTITLGGFDLGDPAYLGQEYRKGGCAAVSVRMGGTEDALDVDRPLASTTEEQELARGDFPGPLAAIARAPFIDDFQLAAAKVDGAAAVILPLRLSGAERTAELMATSSALGLETIVRVCEEAEVDAALAMGAKVLAFGDCTLEEGAALLSKLPKGKKDGVVSVADLPTLDVRGAWKVRCACVQALLL
jgi:hypothetical protein